tara:strand:+ start:17 stop:1510 length:1494 start_codon:yes stop_codon:yes gene_type:complete
MITPNIAPRRIAGSTAAGLFSAAKSSVRAMERTTNTIVKSPDITKNEKLGINYVQFFGSKKNAKILKKSLKTIRDSLVATFAIAKLLKSEITKISKLFGESGGGRRGGGILGSLLGFGARGIGLGIRGAALGIKSLLFFAKFLANPVVLKILGIAAAVGGTFTLGKFLLDNRENIKEFIFSRAKGIFDTLERVIEGIVQTVIGKTFKTEALTNVELESDREIEEGFDKLVAEEDMTQQDAMTQATLNEITRLESERDKLNTAIDEGTFVDDMTTSQMKKKRNAINTRIEDLQTGESTLNKINPLVNFFFGNKLRERSTTQPAYFSPDEGYETASPERKLKMLKELKNRFETQGDTEQIKTVYTQDLIGGKLKPHEVPQALDMIQFADLLDAEKVAGDPDKITVDDLQFSDNDTVKPLTLEDVIRSVPKSERPSQTFLKNIPTSGLTGNVTPKINSSGTDLIQNQSKASSSPSFVIHSNINLDNNYRDYNASELGITF